MKILILLVYLFSGNAINPQSSATSNTELLAGSSQKSWYLYNITPERPGVSCQANSPHSLDNIYTFFANGTVEFDHGVLTEDSDCKEENCCSDLVNFVGTWTFSKGETHLTVLAQHEINNASNSFNISLISASLVELSSDALVLKQSIEGVDYTLEFRAK